MATGLILSSSDINVINETDPSGHPATRLIGGKYGSPVLNSSLSDPLTSGGEFARVFAATNANECFGAYYPLSSVDGGIYSGSIDASKAYSMRAWVRANPTAGSISDHSGIGLNFLGQTHDYTRNSNNPDSYILGGYTLSFSGKRMGGTTFSSAVKLAICRNAVSGVAHPSSFPAIDCDGPAANGVNTYANDTWYRIRFDMIPVGEAMVTLNAYTSSAGDVPSGQEVWVLVGTATTQVTDAVYIDPTLPDNGMGWYAFKDGAGGDADASYIDQFEILVEDL